MIATAAITEYMLGVVALTFIIFLAIAFFRYAAGMILRVG